MAILIKMLPSCPGDIILNKKVHRNDEVFGYVHALLEIIKEVYDLCSRRRRGELALGLAIDM